MRRAEAEQRALERAGREQLLPQAEPDPAKSRTMFGEYVTTKWWPAWKDQHPSSEYGTRKKVEKRILPVFGDIPLDELDPSTIGTWKAAMVAEGLRPRTVNTYLSLLGTILNAAVDDDYLARSPLLRKSGTGRTAATRNQPVPRREVWLLREQLDRLVEAIDPRYRALVLVAALTGMRWGELVALRWDDPRFDQPLDDGAVQLDVQEVVADLDVPVARREQVELVALHDLGRGQRREGFLGGLQALPERAPLPARDDPSHGLHPTGHHRICS
jgi:Phage integrase SAM-like domain